MDSDLNRRHLLRGLVAAGAVTIPAVSYAQTKQLKEPVYRVSKAKLEKEKGAPHALDPALDMAHRRLKYMRDEIKDYACTMVKRELVNGKLGDREYMFAKVRNRKVVNGKLVTPFSIYMYFLKPKAFTGRECIFVEGQNDGKLLAHEAPHTLLYKTLGTVRLQPNGAVAMRGQRYPITDAGIENLLIKLIERGNQDRKRGPCEVKQRTATLNGRKCDVIQVRHPKRDKDYDFYLARIFMDKELQIPVRYAAYDWPAPGRKVGTVIEEYTYTDLKLNVGLQDSDFDHKNPQYLFVRKKRGDRKRVSRRPR